MRGAGNAPELAACGAPLTLCPRLAALYARNRACHGLRLVRFYFPHQALPLSERLGRHFRWLNVVAQRRQSLLDAVSTFGNRLPGPVEFH